MQVTANMTSGAEIDLRSCRLSRTRLNHACALILLALAAFSQARAQTCLSASDIEPATRSALETTAHHFFDMAAQGDTLSLEHSAIPGVASNFSNIEAAVKEGAPDLAGRQPTIRPPFLLQAQGNAPIARAEFYCGVFGANGQTANSAVVVIPDLPPGNYGLVILDIVGAKGASTVSMVLQQVGNDWKLAGYYARQAAVNGHDGSWFAQRAREFKAKGQLHNAWFFFQEARQLLSPVDFMSTMMSDKLYDEAQTVKPADLPSAENPMTLSVPATPPPAAAIRDGQTKPVQSFAQATPRSYQIISMFPLSVGNELDLVLRYSCPDVSNTAQTFQENMAVIRAAVAKYPEIRDAFNGVVARAVEPSGRDYGSLLPVKDIK